MQNLYQSVCEDLSAELFGVKICSKSSQYEIDTGGRTSPLCSALMLKRFTRLTQWLKHFLEYHCLCAVKRLKCVENYPGDCTFHDIKQFWE